MGLRYRYGAWERPASGAYRPGLTPAAWLVGTAALVWVSPVSAGLHDIVLTTDALPLTVAEGPATAVVGYLAFGQVHVYVPVTVPAILLVGELVAAAGGRFRHAVPVVAGLLAATQLLVLSGCGCGTGGVTPLGAAAATAV